jgi:SAM-dependent methyltransferase
MDEIASFNQSKWDQLAAQGILYSRPLLDLTPETAREWLDPTGRLGQVAGQSVLCLASGGGKQSAAFGVLGAQVSVLDLSPEMLAGDRLAAQTYALAMDIRQGDMRDLSAFTDAAFDLVFQPYSLNYIPDPLPVFRQVARVLKPGGRYLLQLANPWFVGLFETDWDGKGYPVRLPYENGAEISDQVWNFADGAGNAVRTPGPRTFRHTLSGVLNPLAQLGFTLTYILEEPSGDTGAEPGSWEHFTNTVVPWFTLWFDYASH